MFRYCLASAVATWADPGLTFLFFLAVVAGLAEGVYSLCKRGNR